MSEEELEVVDDNIVQWKNSDYSELNWQGYRINVVEINGRKYLDPDVITLTTPKQHEEGYTLTMTDKEAKRLYTKQWADEPQYIEKPPISLEVSKEVLLDLVREQPSITINESASQETLFAQVVFELSNLWNGKYHKTTKPSISEFEKWAGSRWDTLKKFLHVARYAGLYTSQTRGKPQRKKAELTEAQKQAEEDEGKWLINPLIESWIKGKNLQKDNKNIKALFKAMRIMDVSPEQFVGMKKETNQKTIDDIGEFLKTPRYRDTRTSENALPKKYMVERDGHKWQLPRTLMSGNIHTKGAWYWNENYGLQGKPKVWYHRTPDATGNEYKGKKWSLESWAMSPDAPDLDADIQIMKWKDGKKIKQAKLWTGSARQLTKDAIERDDQNILYDFVGAIRSFLEQQGVAVFGHQDPDSIWQQVANEPYSATIHLKADQIETMLKTLDVGAKTGVMEVRDYHSYALPDDTGTIKFKDVAEAKSYWHDAYLYFLLSLELGFRQQEAFTIIGKKLKEVAQPKDKSAKSGVYIFPNEDMKVQIYTRKTDRGKKGQKIHGGFIINPTTKELILKRVQQIEDAKASTKSQAEIFKEFGAYKMYKGTLYEENSLIGESGRYTDLGTMNRPATLTKLDKRRGDTSVVKPNQTNRDKIYAIFRFCYNKADCTENYWYDHTLHSLRHVFAQYWLDLSDYNYSFVAELGHWKTERMVKDVYGQQLDSRILARMKNFAGNNPLDTMRKNAEAMEVAPSVEVQKAQDEFGYGTDSDMEVRDQKLRERIYNEGGDYFDVSLPEDQREYINYPKGTNIGFPDKNIGKEKILYKSERGTEDAKNTRELEAGK